MIVLLRDAIRRRVCKDECLRALDSDLLVCESHGGFRLFLIDGVRAKTDVQGFLEINVQLFCLFRRQFFDHWFLQLRG